jgi:hypothetical protein
MELNEDVKLKMLQYLNSLEGVVKSGTDFVADQMPLVLQEYIMYNRCYSTFAIVMSIVLAVIAYKSFSRGMQTIAEDKRNTEPYMVSFTVFGMAAGILGLIIFCHNFDMMMKSWTAPRILVLEQISELIKGMK